MKRSWIYLTLFALLLMAATWTSNTAYANSPTGGTIGPIIEVGTPPDGWQTGTAPWVTDGAFKLPDNDPFGDNASVQYEVHIQGEKHTVQSWGEVYDLLQGGAVVGSIWRQPWANQELPVGIHPEGWCDGSVPWITNGSFKLPENDPCDGQALYQVDLNGTTHENQNWQDAKALTQKGTISATTWRILQQTEPKTNSLFLPLISTN